MWAIGRRGVETTILVANLDRRPRSVALDVDGESRRVDVGPGAFRAV